jgi:hypothetical protein
MVYHSPIGKDYFEKVKSEIIDIVVQQLNDKAPNRGYKWVHTYQTDKSFIIDLRN